MTLPIKGSNLTGRYGHTPGHRFSSRRGGDASHLARTRPILRLNRALGGALAASYPPGCGRSRGGHRALQLCRGSGAFPPPPRRLSVNLLPLAGGCICRGWIFYLGFRVYFRLEVSYLPIPLEKSKRFFQYRYLAGARGPRILVRPQVARTRFCLRRPWLPDSSAARARTTPGRQRQRGAGTRLQPSRAPRGGTTTRAPGAAPQPR